MIDKPDVLEHNVATLLATGGERPRMAGDARARIRAALIARYGVVAAPVRWRLAIAAALAVAAAAPVATAVVAISRRGTLRLPAP